MEISESIREPLSAAVTRLTLCRGDIVLGTGSGFYFRYRNHIFLITNRHVFTGKDNETGKCLNKMAAIPNQVHCQIPTHYEDVEAKIKGIRISSNAFRLLDAEEEKTLWLEHPSYGADCDVVALHIGRDVDRHVYALNDHDFQEFIFRVGEDVLILGFPFGELYKGRLPLWKHGIVATEPESDFDGRPLFLVDSVTHPGMSGAPVLCKIPFGLWNRDKDGTPKPDSYFGGGTKFVGVYSGRVRWPEKDDTLTEQERIFQMQIGCVWRAELIEQILAQLPLSSEEVN